MVKKIRKKAKEAALLKLDLGSGPNPREGFEGVDKLSFGQKWQVDLVERELRMDGSIDGTLAFKPWPWPDASVSEAHCSHTLEHFTGMERCHFWNELWRVLVVGGKCQVITPHWASNRAYGDPTHQWPPVSEMAFYYLSREWRKANAPHTDAEHLPGGFSCNFEATWGYSMHAALGPRNDEYRSEAIQWYKEAAQDTICTVTKKA